MSTLGKIRPRAALAAAATTFGLGLALVAPAPTPAVAPAGAPPERTAAQRTIALPDGFQPEGIATGKRGVAYVGSLANGDIYSFDVSTGQDVAIIRGTGTPSVGLDLDRRRDRLYVAGGDAGTARIVDTEREEVIAEYELTDGPAFVNDVIVAKRFAWFTNSAAPEIYRVPIAKRGETPDQSDIRTFTLTGDWVQPEGFGANGITETPDGTALLVVNSADGTLFRVAKKGERTGTARQVDLGGQSLTNGDGMLQQGRTLYVVRNRLNTVVELKLAPSGLSGRKVGARRSDTFDVPTTIAAARGRLYLPNARFGTEATPETEYTVSVLRKR